MLYLNYMAPASLVLAWCALASAYTEHARDLLTRSMAFMDDMYDARAGYLYGFTTALQHETRPSSWYAAGLLARNAADDVERAVKILDNIIAGQYRDPSEQWYGDYQVYPEEPRPGTDVYPAVIYDSWDPNWRGFIGTTFIVILEEFGGLLPADLCERMVASLHLNARGDTYRVGGVDGDNLYPSYSNPALMKAAVAGWIGRRVDDHNLTAEGEHWGRQIVELFDRNGSLSEFNSGTYTGVSLFALSLWAKYLPADSVLGASGARMISRTWEEVGELYNANMRNLAGPWDRSYGYDMERYLSIMALWIWSLVGLAQSPLERSGVFKPWAIAHNDDFEIGPLISIFAADHQKLISAKAWKSLTTLGEEHFFTTSALSPAYDQAPRNMTTWVSSNLTIGAESFDENVVGGPNKNPLQFNPAVVQWMRNDGSLGFATLWAQVEAMQVEVGQGRLTLEYPSGNGSSTFVFHVSPNGLYGPKNVRSWDDILGLKVSVSGTVMDEPMVTFCGVAGGGCDAVK
jgi:hypothetical protein